MATPDDDPFHVPVLVEQVLHYLAPQPGQTVLDATVGGGGHSTQLARRIAPGGRLICLDRDLDALEAAGEQLEPFRTTVEIILRHSEFSKLASVIEEIGGVEVRLNGCLFDLGVSSYQLDRAPGFSFRRDEYLDGRMNRQGSDRTVAQVIAESSEAELARILWEYGDEPFARRIARRISQLKAGGSKLETSGQLVRIVEEAVPKSAAPKKIHVATKAFQALRIEANNELTELRIGLDAALDMLALGGRVVVLSYHSLEDTIVKSALAARAGRTPSPSAYSPAALLPAANQADYRLLTRKPVMADSVEVEMNVRARSAKLRAAERIA